MNGERLQFLLVLTSDGCRWTFPGGKIKNGEVETAAAAREVKEEADALGDVGEELERESHENDGSIVTFLMRVSGGDLKPREEWRFPTWFDEHQASAVLRTGRNRSDREKWLQTLTRAVEAIRNRPR
jgi:8-oxo-dGTP pyrophosphatase MutT (NUDIX family)